MLVRTSLYGLGRPLLWPPWRNNMKIGIVALLDGRVFIGAFEIIGEKK